jgi:hypothetical protein
MTRDEIIEMAKQAGILHESDTEEIISECGVEVWLSPSNGVNTLERFAKLVAQHERSECLKFCEQVAEYFPSSGFVGSYIGNKIRERGEE